MNARDSFVGRPAVHSTIGGTAVVLLHGLCSTPRELGPVEAALRALDCSVHSLSIEGYSFEADTRRRCAVCFVAWLDAIEREVQRLRATHVRVLLVGISAGASLALGPPSVAATGSTAWC
ncbi:hypothetical protein AB4Z46_23415 [Variovorax sp. M-6]|uniref:hypothetical protein n=1 Tax=Variovorax sp. M-6 TaxID=3233041 RepID=UPI003F99DC0A